MRNNKPVINGKLIILGILVGILLVVNSLSGNGVVKTTEKVKDVVSTQIKEITSTTETTTKVTTTKKVTKKAVKKVATSTKSEYLSYAKQYGGYDDKEMQKLDYLWTRESNWNPNARNKYSGACGIPQALPCSKIKDQQGSNDWKAQIRWGINYIKNRYGTPSNAVKHFKNKGWY